MDSWAADEAFILQKLTGLNNSELGGVVDVNTVAVGGHSSGGEAAARGAIGRPNVKALLSMDAAPVPGQRPPPVPSLLMSTYDRRERFTHHFQIRGIIHNDFATDVALLTEKYPGEISTDRGSVRPARVLELINTYSLAFLDKYLKGGQTSLLDNNSRQYPEMRRLS